MGSVKARLKIAWKAVVLAGRMVYIVVETMVTKLAVVMVCK